MKQLGVDYVDYYWLHGLNGRTYQQAEEMHAFDFVLKKKAEGKIAIPDYFAVYNNMKRSGAAVRLTTQTYYSTLSQTHGKASECLKCGKCEKLCPQHLPIRTYLQDVAAALE